MGKRGQLKEILLKDIYNENDSKRVSIILRFNSVIMCIYFIALLCSFMFLENIPLVVLSIPSFIIFGGCFYMTYQNKSGWAVACTMVTELTVIIIFVVFFGWFCGAQNYLLVLLVLSFITSYSSRRNKIFRAVLLCGLRLLLYWYTSIHEPLIALNAQAVTFLQVTNVIVMFSALSCCVLISVEDILEMEKKLLINNDKLKHLALEDPLTGLANRRSIREYLGAVTEEHVMTKSRGVSVAIADIDYFKDINDQYGHDCGDIVLLQAAQKFENFMQGKGMVGRWGGEEFVFVFFDMNGKDAAFYLNKLLESLQEHEFVYQNKEIKITITFGLAEYDSSKGIDATITEADKKLYQGKKTGRNQVVF